MIKLVKYINQTFCFPHGSSSGVQELRRKKSQGKNCHKINGHVFEVSVDI